jgi:hypothetical protein
MRSIRYTLLTQVRESTKVQFLTQLGNWDVLHLDMLGYMPWLHALHATCLLRCLMSVTSDMLHYMPYIPSTLPIIT